MPSTRNPRGPAAYIRHLFAPTDHVAILAVPPRREDDAQQRFPSAEAAADPAFQSWLRRLNATGYNIYIGVNPVNPVRGKREKRDIAGVRRLQLDLDEAGPESLRRILAAASAGTLPKPVSVLQSSADRYQILWNAADAAWTADAAEDMNRRLAREYLGDRAAVDIARVFRLPGYRNKKPGRADAMVTWTAYAGGDTLPGDFRAVPAKPPDAPIRTRAPGEWLRSAAAGETTITQSERDWAWCREELRHGADLEVTIARLQARRPDKPNPAYYARRTVERAAASIEAERQPPRTAGIDR